MKRIFGNKKLMIIIVAVAVLLVIVGVLFSQKGRDKPPEEEEILPPEPIEAPIQYALGDVKFPALPTGEKMTVYDLEAESLLLLAQEAKAEAEEELEDESATPPATEEDAADAEEETSKEEPEEDESAEDESTELIAYRYEGMTDAAGLVQAYANLLTATDLGFRYADETLMELEDGGLTEAPRTVIEDSGTGELAAAPSAAVGVEEPVGGTCWLIQRQPKPEEGVRQAIALRLVWDETTCEVTAELVPASMTIRPGSSSPIGSTYAGLTFSGAVDTIRSMHPAVLELEGESMDDYRVYSRDGLVLINEQSCMRIDIYQRDKRTGTNIAAGTYFISADGMHLYIFNKQTQTVRELSMTVTAAQSTATQTP